MAKGDFYFPLFYQKLLTSTTGWKDDEFGAYLKLLIYQFDKGCIPDDIEKLARIAPSVKKHWESLLKEKFVPNGNGGLINIVMDEIRQDVNSKKEINKGNGKKGGRPKIIKLSNQTVTEIKRNGFQNETETKAILIDNSKYIKEREHTPKTFWESEEDKKHSLSHCLLVSLKDDNWVSKNKTDRTELENFNLNLEKQGIVEKTILDYKKHFFHWNQKNSNKQPFPEKTTMVM